MFRLRICLVGAGLYPIPPLRGGAIESHIYNLAKQFLLDGHAVSIIDRFYSIPLPSDSFIMRLKVPYLRWKLREGAVSNIIDEMLFGVCAFLVLLLIRKKVDIIHAHNVIAGAACAFASIVLNKPFIYTSHNTMWTVNNIGWATKIVERLEKFVISNSSKTIAVCSALKAGFVKKGRISAEKITVIPNGVDTTNYKPGLDSSDLKQRLGLQDSKIILFVGRIMFGKGVDILIDAIPPVLEKTGKFENLKFVIVGPKSESFDTYLKSGYYLRLKSLLEKQGIKNYAMFTGLLSTEDLRKLYSSAYMFVLPSRAEAEPLVLLEAMSSGLPLIGSNVGGIPEIIDDGQIGFVVRANRSDELACAILRLIPRQVHDVFSKKARNVAVQRYDWKVISAKILQIYQQATPGSR